MIFHLFCNFHNNINDLPSGKAGSILTRERSDTVRKWIDVCERALLDGTDTIKDLFILKCKHGYQEEKERNINININNKPLISADELPKFLDLKPQ